jgi:hypothetical protein
MAYAINANIANEAMTTHVASHVASRAAKTGAQATATTLPFWTRLINAMVESRMRSAQMELRRHARFLEELESGKAGFRTCETFERSA